MYCTECGNLCEVKSIDIGTIPGKPAYHDVSHCCEGEVVTSIYDLEREALVGLTESLLKENKIMADKIRSLRGEASRTKAA